MKTYSTEFLRIFLSICSEVDVLARRVCQLIQPKAKVNEIREYRSILEPTLHLSAFQVEDFYIQSPIKPFEEWEQQDYPQWWGDHNAVKHDRFNRYQDANLQNTIWSLAGLYVLNIYHYYNYLREAQLRPQSTLFRPIAHVHLATSQMTYGYTLPHGDKLYPESPT